MGGDPSILEEIPTHYAVMLVNQQSLAGQLGNNLIKGPGHQIAQQGEIVISG